MTNSNIKIRETFGIIDPLTKKEYPDILKSFLLQLRITKENRLCKYIYLTENDPFLLHCDTKTKKIIKEKGFCDCIVSFQVRTTGKIALARVFTTKAKTANNPDGV